MSEAHASGNIISERGELRQPMPRHGATVHRALAQDYVARSAFAKPGAFGRMFPTLPYFEFDRTLLERLSNTMKAESPTPDVEEGGPNNPTISAGYTFLGQFIDHDITFDPTSSLERQNDPEAIYNFRTPYLELDSLYGSGQNASPHLYDQTDPDKFLIGHDADNEPNDLPRNIQGTALIGDPRNNENLIISQLHLIFLKFHNRVVDHLRAHNIPAGMIFEEAQRIVRWHYQWIVAHEFLPRIVGQTLVDEILGSLELGTTGQPVTGNTLDDNLRYFVYEDEPFIPVEFAVAAYRFGHSQVRPGYPINNDFGGPLFPDLAVSQNLTDTAPRVLLKDRSVEWSNFFEMNGPTTPPQEQLPTGPGAPRPSKMIDTKISPPLFKLPGLPADAPAHMQLLPLRNLLRGQTFRLPWGQRVAAAMGIQPLPDEVLGLTELGFPPRRAPLWYYILKEAEVLRGGTHLGPVGGRIVAEVLLGLLHGDPKSYISQDPLWDPSQPVTSAPPLPAFTWKKFTVPDLIRFAQGVEIGD